MLVPVGVGQGGALPPRQKVGLGEQVGHGHQQVQEHLLTKEMSTVTHNTAHTVHSRSPPDSDCPLLTRVHAEEVRKPPWHAHAPLCHSACAHLLCMRRQGKGSDNALL